jgi:hypothetical protein
LQSFNSLPSTRPEKFQQIIMPFIWYHVKCSTTRQCVNTGRENAQSVLLLAVSNVLHYPELTYHLAVFDCIACVLAYIIICQCPCVLDEDHGLAFLLGGVVSLIMCCIVVLLYHYCLSKVTVPLPCLFLCFACVEP